MAGSPSEVERRYDIVLISAGPMPRRVARTIASFTDLRKAEALELLRTAPVPILEGASYATAEGARQELEGRGATVEVRAYEVEAPEPAPSFSARLAGWKVALVIAAVVIIMAAIAVLVTIATSLSSLSGICNPACL